MKDTVQYSTVQCSTVHCSTPSCMMAAADVMIVICGMMRSMLVLTLFTRRYNTGATWQYALLTGTSYHRMNQNMYCLLIVLFEGL